VGGFFPLVWQCAFYALRRLSKFSCGSEIMGIVSYAQNLEDVILQRVLTDVKTGFYVDVGASHPCKDSVTYAFYQRGWRGICVEPLGYETLWRELRPADILIRGALGKESGHTNLHVYDKFQQVSTCSAETVTHWKQFDILPSQIVTVPVYTLNEILALHLGARPLHFISMDVEGMERDVLLGLDLQKYRPWIMIVEATIPGTPNPCFDNWEPIILAAGYRAVYFDGLNRFYLSEEQQRLQARFGLPPNVWDDYVLAAQISQQERISALEKEVKTLEEKLARRRCR
jgi:FkbM family methyltransferase